MMKLRELLAKVATIETATEHQALEKEVTRLCTNSQTCQEGDLFIGMPGTKVDGGEFWQSAIQAGAIAALVTPEAATKLPPQDQCLIKTQNMIAACGELAAAFHDYPASKLNLVGVTGTNGKTTTTHLIEYFLLQSQLPTALFGTLYTRWAGYQKTAAHTTPFAVDLQAQMAQAVAAGSKCAIMEVSSHALAQGRVKGCSFEVAVFSNLTQDHLDYHKSMEDYFQAKALLFSEEYLKGQAIVNLDDDYGKRLIQQLGQDKVWTYSVNDPTADLYTSKLDYQATGVSGTLHTPEGEIAFASPLVGQFNLANLLAATGAALHLGVKLSVISATLSQFHGVPGRMERVQVSEAQDISVIVDYAHTPDSLENLLKAARPFIKNKMICVFGCGGDRDRTKRPLMGKIAADLADLAVVTSDNPRTEDPQQILDDVVAGIPQDVEIIVESDRAVAIATAIASAEPGDGVLIAGKGHEDYQIIGTTKIHFDDREQALQALQNRT